jgi:hypothetical protein
MATVYDNKLSIDRALNMGQNFSKTWECQLRAKKFIIKINFQ